NRDLFYSVNYLHRLIAYRASMVETAGGFVQDSNGACDYDLSLRIIALSAEADIQHIPGILYHCRVLHVADRRHTLAESAAMGAIQAHLARLGQSATVVQPRGTRTGHRVVYPVPLATPLVSVIVPTRNNYRLLRQCVESLASTTYARYELIIID